MTADQHALSRRSHGGNPAFRPVVKSIVQQERCSKLHKDTTTKAGTRRSRRTPTSRSAKAGRARSATKRRGNYYGPGHTGGDAVIFFEKANVVHMGDLMFNRLHPARRPAERRLDQELDQRARKGRKKHRDATFIFGHAKAGLPVTGPSKELLYLKDYFSAVLDHVQKGCARSRPKNRSSASRRCLASRIT